MDPQVKKRAIELYKYVGSTNIRLKRIYKYTRKDIDIFWQEVWDFLLKNPDQEVEDIVAAKLKLGRQNVTSK